MAALSDIRHKPLWWQLVVCSLLIGVPACVCYAFTPWIGYQVVAFILLLIISLIAAVFDRWPVLISATLSAFAWDFFFIPPRFTITVSSREDFFLLLMYFVIGLLNVVITRRIRETELRTREKEEQERIIALYTILLQTLSHELRTPIATIIGSIDTLREQEARLSGSQQEELKAAIQTAALRLDDQVEKLLRMSRIEAGSIPLLKDWCSIPELVHGCIKRNREVFAGRTIITEVSDDMPLFRIDGGLIEIVLFNLLQNAHLYTPAHAAITLKSSCTDDALRFEISDEGPGFPEELLETVFDKFVRLPNARSGGTGLGLSIARGFVEAHNGTITLRNRPEGGAQFTLVIPAESSYINSLKHE